MVDFGIFLLTSVLLSVSLLYVRMRTLYSSKTKIQHFSIIILTAFFMNTGLLLNITTKRLNTADAEQ